MDSTQTDSLLDKTIVFKLKSIIGIDGALLHMNAGPSASFS